MTRAVMLAGVPVHYLGDASGPMTKKLGLKEVTIQYMPGCTTFFFSGSDHANVVEESARSGLAKMHNILEAVKFFMKNEFSEESLSNVVAVIGHAEPRGNAWAVVIAYEMASICVAPFGFGARLQDLLLCGPLGAIDGVVQLVADNNEAFSFVFKVTSTLITTMLARLLGNITRKRDLVVCCSVRAQSAGKNNSRRNLN